MATPSLYLASRSPRRQALLHQIGIGYRLVTVSIDEARGPAEAPADFVCRMAMAKALAGAKRLGGAHAPVLGADTVVVVDGAVLGKPRAVCDARDQLARLSGRSHQVLSAVALVAEHRAVRLSVSRVWFRALTAIEIDRYCATGEPLDKAGSYAIQGRAALFIQRLEGSYSGVMGLPLFETGELLSEAGMAVLGK